MTNSLVQPSKSLGYSDIYLDFLAGDDPSARFYIAKSLEDVAARLDAVEFDRKEMVRILEKQNRTYRASEQTLAAIEKLKDPQAVCVFAGQQAGLFGGPLYTVIKAVAIVKAARAYEEKLGRPVVPVFWIAGDDHDFEEVNHCFVLDRTGEITKAAYETPPEREVPVAQITLSDADALEKAKSDLKEALGETDFTPDVYAMIDEAYTPEDTLVTAFGKLMARLTGELGLVLFCPGDDDAKRVAIPMFKKILDSQQELHDIIVRTNNEIVQSGYHVQVEKSEDATHLFYDLDGRKPVMHDGEGFKVGDTPLTREELGRALDEHPERFSPDVMTRPVLQSFLLPTVSQKGGPAEIAYLAQINPIFNLFGLPAPVHKARPTVTVVEARFQKLMDEHEITFEELTGDIEQVVNRVLQKSFPHHLEEHFEKLRKDFGKRFKEFVDVSLEFDPNLQQMGEHSYGKIDYTLKQFEDKVFSSHKKKEKQTRDRIYKLHNALYPNRGLQERTLNVTYFLSKYGFDFISFLHDNMDSEEKAHQLLYISEMTP